jgi:hypothetical protein
MVQKLIIVLAVIAVIVLYQGMHHELAAPRVDLRRVDANLILGAIRSEGQPCDAVDSFKLLGLGDQGFDAYLARCHDGGRYVFFKSTAKGEFSVKSCAEEAALGYRCPL